MTDPSDEVKPAAILIIRPWSADLRIGPLSRQDADEWTRRLAAILHQRTAPKDTEAYVVDYKPHLPHIAADEFAPDPADLPRLIRAEPDTGFPDAHTRLVIVHGRDAADKLWAAACAANDAAMEAERTVRKLKTAIEDAMRAAQMAVELAAGLPEPFELADGTAGNDLRAFLNDAARGLRAAELIAGWRVSLLEGEGGAISESALKASNLKKEEMIMNRERQESDMTVPATAFTYIPEDERAYLPEDEDSPVPEPCFPFRAYGVHLSIFGEDGGVAAEGHVSLLRFVAACNRMARENGLISLADVYGVSVEEVLESIQYVWAVPEQPQSPDREWQVRWAGVTKATPGAIPLTIYDPS
jgi:hypothetical protein